MAEIQTVGVVGAGTMGSGIAHVFARAGYRACCKRATAIPSSAHARCSGAHGGRRMAGAQIGAGVLHLREVVRSPWSIEVENSLLNVRNRGMIGSGVHHGDSGTDFQGADHGPEIHP